MRSSYPNDAVLIQCSLNKPRKQAGKTRRRRGLPWIDEALAANAHTHSTSTRVPKSRDTTSSLVQQTSLTTSCITCPPNSFKEALLCRECSKIDIKLRVNCVNCGKEEARFCSKSCARSYNASSENENESENENQIGDDQLCLGCNDYTAMVCGNCLHSTCADCGRVEDSCTFCTGVQIRNELGGMLLEQDDVHVDSRQLKLLVAFANMARFKREKAEGIPYEIRRMFSNDVGENARGTIVAGFDDTIQWLRKQNVAFIDSTYVDEASSTSAIRRHPHAVERFARAKGFRDDVPATAEA